MQVVEIFIKKYHCNANSKGKTLVAYLRNKVKCDPSICKSYSAWHILHHCM